MEFGIRRREQRTAAVRRTATPAGRASAGCFDQGDRRVYIVWLQPCLDDEIDMPSRKERICVAVQTVSHETRSRCQAEERFPL